MNYAKRIAKVREIMADRGIDVLFLPSCGDRQYLTGLSSERPGPTHHHRSGDWLDGLFLTGDHALYACPWMIRQGVGEEMSALPVPGETLILEEGMDYRAYAEKIAVHLGLRNPVIGVPKAAAAKSLINLSQAVASATFVNIEAFTCEMRMRKEPEEIALLRKAAAIADQAFLETVAQIQIGVTELEVAQELELRMRRLGAEGLSFSTDVMCKRPGQPFSGGSGLVKLEYGSNVAFDFGCVYQGYCSDTGRTIYIGEPCDKWRQVHILVMNAQQAALDAIRPGAVTCAELDRIARRVINQGGYDKEFFHRLGHGIGVDVHEYPYLNKGYDVPLQENMTITVEPSVMVAEEFRIRVEDVVLVTNKNAEPLNQVTREMIVID